MSSFTQRTVKVKKGASFQECPRYTSSTHKFFIYRTGKDGKTEKLTSREYLEEQEALDREKVGMNIKVQRKWND